MSTLKSLSMKRAVLVVGFVLTAIGFGFIGIGIWDLGNEASKPGGVDLFNGGPDIVVGVIVAIPGILAIILTDKL